MYPKTCKVKTNTDKKDSAVPLFLLHLRRVSHRGVSSKQISEWTDDRVVHKLYLGLSARKEDLFNEFRNGFWKWVLLNVPKNLIEKSERKSNLGKGVAFENNTDQNFWESSQHFIGRNLGRLLKKELKRKLKRVLKYWNSQKVVHLKLSVSIRQKRRRSIAKKLKFSIKNFFSKCDQIRSILWTWSHLLEKSLIENVIFYIVTQQQMVNISGFFWPVNRYLFRALLNVYDEVFCENSWWLKAVNCFCKKVQRIQRIRWFKQMLFFQCSYSS